MNHKQCPGTVCSEALFALTVGLFDRWRLLKKLIRRVDLAVHFDLVIQSQLAAAAKFNSPVQVDSASLDHHFGMSTGLRNANQLEELIETQWFAYGE